MWLGVYFPALLVPKDATAPVVVYHSALNKVVQCNAQALDTGVEVGMGLGSASALCANLDIIPYCTEQERLLLTQIMYSLYRVNGDICLEHSDELLIRCDRHDYYYGSAEVHLRVLLRQLKQHQQPLHFATGNTPEQASVLARAKTDQLLDSDKVMARLQGLPVTQLKLDNKTIQQLQRVGIRSAQALFAMPMEELAGRFTQPFIKYLYALKGLHKFGRRFYQPPEQFCESIELPFDMESKEHLLRWAGSLLALLQTYLSSRNKTTQHLTLILTDTEKCVLPLTLRSGTAKYRTEEWSPILALLLDKTTLERPIRTMQLRCESSMQASPNTADFFVDHRVNAIEAHKLFDLLQTRLGEGAFHPPKSRAYHFAKHWPTGVATPPFMLTHGQTLATHGHVIAGPQRIQTGWWHAPLKRDYFLVETDQAERLWAYRDDSQQWFFQGWFS